MTPLRFVFVLTSLQLNGGVLLVIEYANGLARRNHAVQLLTPKGTVDPQLTARLHPAVDLLECGASLPESRSPIGLLRLLWSMARNLPPADIVVATHTPTTAAVMLARLLGRRKHSTTTSSSLVPSPKQKSTIRVWLYMDYPEMFRGRRAEAFLLRAMPRRFDMIWTISTPWCEYVATQTDAPVVMTSAGLPNAALLFASTRRQAKRGNKRVLYVGNSLPRKGLREFLQAMQLVSQQIEATAHELADPETITVVIAGAEDCLQLIDEYAVDRTSDVIELEFHAWPSDQELVDLYAGADIFVSASWSEGLGYPPLEAMACGTPVVLTDSVGVRDYALHEKNCLMVAPRDAAAIAAAVQRLLTDNELAVSLSIAGRETARGYEWADVITRVEQSVQHF